MKDSEYVVALDLGTSKIIAMAARKNDQGMLSILHAEKVKSEGCIRRGAVYNINDTYAKYRSLYFRLDRNLMPKIGKVYVGIGGQSLHTRVHSITRPMSGEVVSRETIDSLYEECKSYKPDGWDVLGIVSPEFYLDGKAEAKPIGVACRSVEASYRLILGRPELRSNLNKSVKERMLIEVIDYLITPLATAEAVLTQSEKEKGCVLVEMGAGVTYVSVYKNNILRHLVTLPLGGDAITKDLADADLTEEEAETIKLGGDLGEKDYGKIEDIIKARSLEIVENIVEQIHQSGYAGRLSAGIAVTGGGSNMIDIRDMLNEKTKMEVRQAVTKKTLINNISEWANDPSCSAVIGMLSLAEENCAKTQQSTTPQPQQGSSNRGKSNLFEDDEAIKEAEKLRQQKIEEERIRREEERIRREEERRKKKESEKNTPNIFTRLGKGLGKGVEKVSKSLFDEEGDEAQGSNNKEENNNENA